MFKSNNFTGAVLSTLTGFRIEDHRTIVELEAGKVIAYHMPLPSTVVTNLHMFFRDNCVPVLNDKLSKLNELYRVDMDKVREVSFIYWKLRYNLCHDLSATGFDYTQRINLTNEFELYPEYRNINTTVIPASLTAAIVTAMGF